MVKIGVIDYGMGNLHSVEKALQAVAPDASIQVSSDKQFLSSVDKLVFPGVGAIRDCMRAIREQELDKVIENAVASKPVLAICVGMQALLESSEENDGVECLGIIPGQVKQLQHSSPDIKIPHMGWNQVKQIQTHPIWADIPDNSRFYFVHSFAVHTEDAAPVIGETDYGQRFVAAMVKNNLVAVQFHPEKSQTVGLQLLKNFIDW